MSAKRELSQHGSLALDIETSGDIKNLFSLKPIMIQIGNLEKQWIIDPREIDPMQFLKIIQNKIIIGHNLKFDLTVLKLCYKIEFPRVFDTMIADMVLNCGLDVKHGLDMVVRRYIDPYAYTNQGNLFLPPITKNIRKSFATTELEPYTEEQVIYGALDVFYAYGLYLKLADLLDKEDLVRTAYLEFQYLKVLVEMEINGMPFNAVAWMKLVEANKKRSDEALQKLVREHVINWNSWKQVVKVFKEYGIDTKIFDKKTGELKDTADVKVLQKQVSSYPILGLYVTYRKNFKLHSTYGEKYLKFINPVTKRLHTSYVQLLETGRISSWSPNLQNQPRNKEIRACYESQDYIVSADYATQELRVLADAAEDFQMMATVQKKDFHLATAKLVFNNENLTAEDKERDLAKSLNFGIPYGIGAGKVASNFDISMSSARTIINGWYVAFPKVKPYFEEGWRLVKENGYVLIDPVIGRKSYIPYYEKWKWLKEHQHIHPKYSDKFGELNSMMERTSNNFRIQGNSANVTKWAQILLLRHPERHLFKMIMVCHD